MFRTKSFGNLCRRICALTAFSIEFLHSPLKTEDNEEPGATGPYYRHVETKFSTMQLQAKAEGKFSSMVIEEEVKPQTTVQTTEKYRWTTYLKYSWILFKRNFRTFILLIGRSMRSFFIDYKSYIALTLLFLII